MKAGVAPDVVPRSPDRGTRTTEGLPWQMRPSVGARGAVGRPAHNRSRSH